MSLAQKLAWEDTVLPFLLDDADVRGRVVRLGGALDGILAQHDYPAPVEALVAEMALLTALIGQGVQPGWKLSLQLRSEGPVRMIATDCIAPAKEGEPALIRGYAGFDPDGISDADPTAHLGPGYFAALLDKGRGGAPYSGVTPLDPAGPAASAENYFAQSEQLPTRFALAFERPPDADGWLAGGVMIQHMPEASPSAPLGAAKSGPPAASEQADPEDWNRARILLDSVEQDELVGPGVSPLDLLVRLFHEDTPRVFDAQPVRFGCTCSEARVRDCLSAYSGGEVEEMAVRDGKIIVDCQFCGARYSVDPDTLETEAGNARAGS